MSLPVLYSFRRCPYAMRARLAIAASNQRCQLREVVLRDKPQALIEASPKATVPVVVLPDGQVLEESLDIMLWALRKNDPDDWLKPEQGNLADMLVLVDDCDRQFKRHLDRYKYPQRFADEPAPPLAGDDVVELGSSPSGPDPALEKGVADGDAVHRARSLMHRTAGAQWLLGLELRLREHAYLFGGRPALADMAIAPFVRQFAHVDKQWFDAQPWVSLRAWLEAWMASDIFTGVMSKYPKWTPESDPQVFPDV